MDRRLRQFLAVAETGNVSLAAEAMNVSQPTVSVNLRKLEEAHGVSLFERSSRGVVLTDYGRILYEHARVMARLDAHAAAEIRARKLLDRPALKIGCGHAWWPLFVRQAVGAFRRDHPHTLIHVEICSSFDGLRHLLSGDIHCFIGSRVRAISDGLAFSFASLFVVEDAYFVRSGHPLAGKTVLRQDLAAFPRLDVAPLVNRHLGIVEAPAGIKDPEWSHPLRTPLSSNSVAAGLDLLKDCDAYLVYPVSVKPEFDQAGVTVLDVRDRPTDKVDIGVYTLDDIKGNEAVRIFLDALGFHAIESIELP
ncbi:MAG: LysR family transcriptional regulator [Rubricella sp.]